MVTNNILKPIVSVGNDIEIGCKGESVSLKATAQPHPNTLDYLWESLSGSLLGLSPTVTTSNLGSYSVLVRDLTSGCSTRDTINILPNADYARFTLADTTALTCIEPKATLKAVFNTQRDKYSILWTASAGGILPTGKILFNNLRLEKQVFITSKQLILLPAVCFLTVPC